MSDKSDYDSDSVEEIITVRPLPVPRLKPAQEARTFLKPHNETDGGRGSEWVRHHLKQVVVEWLTQALDVELGNHLFKYDRKAIKTFALKKH